MQIIPKNVNRIPEINMYARELDALEISQNFERDVKNKQAQQRFSKQQQRDDSPRTNVRCWKGCELRSGLEGRTAISIFVRFSDYSELQTFLIAADLRLCKMEEDNILLKMNLPD